MRGSLSSYRVEVDGGDEEAAMFSSAVEEEDDGDDVLLLPGAGDGVVEVAEVAVAVLACSVLPVVLHGAPATAFPPFCSR